MSLHIEDSVLEKPIRDNNEAGMVLDPVVQADTAFRNIGCLALCGEEICRGCLRMDELTPICHLFGVTISAE